MTFKCKDCGSIRKKCEVSCNADVRYISGSKRISQVEVVNIYSEAMTRHCLSCGSTNVKMIPVKRKGGDNYG